MSTIIVGGWRWVVQRDRYAAGQQDRYAAGRRNRYAAEPLRGGSAEPLRGGSAEPLRGSGLTASRYAASDYVSGTQIRDKFYRSDVW